MKHNYKDISLRQEPLPLDWVKTPDKHTSIYARADLLQEVQPTWFDANYWQRKQAIVGESKGRYTTYFVTQELTNQNPLNMVLRHYYRGGLVRHVSRDKFVYTGLVKTRCIRELTMLAKMSEMGLPVPKPVAAKVTRNGLLCSNDILIETIENAKDGYNHLKNGLLSDEVWFEMGKVIRAFHDAGVYHSDLNIHNILIDQQGDVFLIDFDNCEFKSNPNQWRESNLQRLRRSLDKEKGLLKAFAFDERNWQTLIDGYGR